MTVLLRMAVAKQLAQIIAKDLNCALGGGIGQLAAQLVFKAGMNEAAVGVAGGGIHKLGAFAAGLCGRTSS